MADVKVYFDHKWMGTEGGGPGSESCWAESLGQGQYAKLANTPFFAYGATLGDVVEITSDGDVLRVENDGGRRSARLMMADGTPLEWVSDIIRGEFGLGRDETAGEGAAGILYAVTYPAAKQDDAVALFDRLVERGLVSAWEQSK